MPREAVWKGRGRTAVPPSGKSMKAMARSADRCQQLDRPRCGEMKQVLEEPIKGGHHERERRQVVVDPGLGPVGRIVAEGRPGQGGVDGGEEHVHVAVVRLVQPPQPQHQPPQQQDG